MTEIKLYNTRTRRKEVFQPIDPQDVRMYVCGPTVYDRAHIGNARPVVVFDVLYRLLRHKYGENSVTYVRNFTDVDDRINAKSAETGRPIRDITTETIAWYHEDMDALGALRPSVKGVVSDKAEPRCTDYIEQMIEMSQQLIDTKNSQGQPFAYAAEGHVLFSVEAYEKYGKLSGRSVEDMIAGARVEVAPYKKNPMDFVIWKPSSDDQPGWDSPWGRGRPGWHIECSAMARELLGEVFDIHGGGLDLQFPHHENELAQSCCAHDTDVMANWWMHNEMLRVEGEKMSKSLGNFFTVRDLLDQGIPGEVIRFAFLSTHYRAPLDWTARRAEDAEKALRRWRSQVEGVDAGVPAPGVIAALADDLNTVQAMTELHRLSADGDAATLKASAQFFGLLSDELSGWEAAPEAGDASVLIEGLISDRQDARKNKDFARADAIRDGFVAAGVIVKDTPDGAVWELSKDFDASKLEALR